MSTSGTRIRSGVRRAIVNPVAMVVLALLLAHEVSRVSQFYLPWKSSWAGERIARLTSSQASITAQSPSQVFVVRENHTFTVIDPERESWDELSRLLTDRPQDVLEISYTATTREHGFWMPTRRELRLGIRASDFGGDFSPAEQAAARAAAAHATMARDLGPKRADRAAEADLVERSIIWRGVALNIYTLALLGLLAWSLMWIPASIRRWRHYRRRRDIARGLCPDCGYNMKGAESALCPECGARASPQVE